VTKIEPDKLKEILAAHALWARGAAGGSRANLIGAYLSRADLSRANLIGADLIGAYLSRADLSRANLIGADLIGADLSRADLSRANLIGADLIGADLSDANLIGADLSRANLSDADLSRADLRGANLIGANLIGADLIGADLSDADLSRANLRGANLRGAKNAEIVIAQTLIVPDVGAFDAWKKLGGGHVAHLRIPAKAKRVNASGRKCRASEARVIAIYDKDGSKTSEAVASKHDSGFFYRAGAVVKPHHFKDDRWQECAGGIHFFITRAEAEAY